MYELLGLEAPKITSRPKPKTAPKLVIDRTGENDRARYSGLKLGQVLDDDMQAKALEEVQEKVKRGESLKPKLQEEMYVRPFADKRNVGPKQTPNWTPERLDEWGKEQGKAMAWARKAREGEFVGDPMETLDLEISQKAYSILTGLLVATVFGKSTPTLLVRMDLENLLAVRETLQAPALVLLLAAVGSAILAAVQASSLNRNQAVWFIKGLLGGPLTIQQLQSLSGLSTQGEIDAQERAKRHQ